MQCFKFHDFHIVYCNERRCPSPSYFLSFHSLPASVQQLCWACFLDVSCSFLKIFPSLFLLPEPLFPPPISPFLVITPSHYSSLKCHFQRILTNALDRLLLHPTAVYAQFSSVEFSRSVVSDSWRPHESQHARPPCSSPSPGVHSDSRPSSP